MSKTKLKLTSPEGELLQEFAPYREILREAYVAFDNSNELADGYSTVKYQNTGVKFHVSYVDNRQMVVSDSHTLKHAVLFLFHKNEKVTVYASVSALSATLAALSPHFQLGAIPGALDGTLNATDTNPNTLCMSAKLLLELASISCSSKHAETATLSNGGPYNTYQSERRSPLYVPGTEDVIKIVFTPKSITVQRKPASSAKYQAHVFVSRSANAGLHTPTTIHAVARKTHGRHAVQLALCSSGSFLQATFAPIREDHVNDGKECYPVRAIVPHTMRDDQATALATVLKRATTKKP